MTLGFPLTNRARVAAAIFTAALCIMAIFAAFDPAAVETPGLLMLVAGHTTAGVLFLRFGRRPGSPDRNAWTALAIALFCGAGGVLLLGLLSQFGYVAPAFGPVDIVFLGGYAAMVWGLTLLARRGAQGSGWLVTLVDTAVGAVALATFVWVWIGHSLIEVMQGADLTARIIAPIYPILDTAVIVGLAAMTIRRTAFRLDPKLIVLSIGLSIQVVADFLFLLDGVGASFVDTAPRLDLFLFSSACYVAIGLLFDTTWTPREFPERGVSFVALMWPYVLGLGVVAMHVVGLVRLGIPNDELVTLIGALGVGILVFLRQWIAIRHTRSRVEQQRLELISSVSHEIRTPLTGLVGYLELLADPSIGLGPEESQNMLRIASAEAAQLGRIITDMIAMARHDGQGLAVSPGPTDLGDVCEAALDAAQRSRVTVSVQHPDVMQVDRDRLVQALSNLVANADKYGNERIHVAAGRIGDAMVLEVHDDGPGVPVRYQERIFEQFERGAHRYNAGVPGMGVGLAIVRAIARAHGGDVDYRPSELLGGACFSISVPANFAPSTEEDPTDATLETLAS